MLRLSAVGIQHTAMPPIKVLEFEFSRRHAAVKARTELLRGSGKYTCGTIKFSPSANHPFTYMLDWLATPLSGTLSHQILPWAYWHAMCVMLPLGV